MKKVVILSTGDELITGRVVDTNSAYIADKVWALGLEVVAVLKVGDSRERLHWALDHAAAIGDLIIGTGGLGPTTDDLTTEIAGEFVGLELELNEEIGRALKQRFEARGLPWTQNNLKQAYFPKGAEIIPNPRGTAPGFRVATLNQKQLLWLSGVPREMESMMEETVLPWLSRQRDPGDDVSSITFKIYGLTESRLGDLLKPIPLTSVVSLSYRAHYPDLSLRRTVRGGSERKDKLRELADEIRKLIGPHIYTEGAETLEEIVGRLLRERGRTLAVAESCTGGFLSHRITRVAGSSDYFKGGVVAYSNHAKQRFLEVGNRVLEEHGAVSRETALQMAKGARRHAAADFGLGVTGVAGPSGGSAEVPVGTVWIGLDREAGTEARDFRFHGDRERVIHGASQAALYWLRAALVEDRG
jgi:nicotinamide-nucleotide amidase